MGTEASKDDGSVVGDKLISALPAAKAADPSIEPIPVTSSGVTTGPHSNSEHELDGTLGWKSTDPTRVNSSPEAADSFPHIGNTTISSAEVRAKNTWSQIPASRFSVRGKTYLSNREKVIAEDALGVCIGVDMLKSKIALEAISTSGSVNTGFHRFMTSLKSEFPPGKLLMYTFKNFTIDWAHNMHLTYYFFIPDSHVSELSASSKSLYDKFFAEGGDAFRASRLKVIPLIVDGPAVVQFAVKPVPCIVGSKLTGNCFRGADYFELTADIGSSFIARPITGLLLTHASALAMDVAVVIEATEVETLPERVLGCARLSYPVINADMAEL